ASQVERPRTFARTDRAPHLEVVGLPARVDDFEVKHLDVRAAHVQPDRLEAALAPSDADRVAVYLKQVDLLTAQLFPAPARPGTSGPRPGHASELTEHAHNRLAAAAEIGPRAIRHFDRPQEAAFAAQIERQLRALLDQPVNANVFRKAVEIDETDRDQMH